MNDAISVCDVAIIGAGITGLNTAYRLQQLRPDWHIRIFEKKSNSGGRLSSLRLDLSGPTIEFGAARFHIDQHMRIRYLLDEFAIETQPFDYECGEMRSQGHLSKTAHEFCWRLLRNVDSLSPQEKSSQTFLATAKNYLSDIELNELICAIGYDALYHPSLALGHGLDILLHHPETPNQFGKQPGKWRSPSLGFQELARRIEANLQTPCSYNHQLISVEEQPNNVVLPFLLHFNSEKVQTKVASRFIVCATHLRDQSEIKYPWDPQATQIDNLIDVPLTKGYVAFPEAWWHNLELSGKCVTTKLPFRKLYFPRSGKAFQFYSDSNSAIELGSRLSDGTALPALIAEIQDCLSLTKNQQQQLKRYHCQWRFWPRGMAFWNFSTEIQMPNIVEPVPNFIVCSDAYTPYLGWVEGCLMSSGAAVIRLTGTASESFNSSSIDQSAQQDKRFPEKALF